jgi:ATP-dependent Clp protease adapter protein ClpS
MKDPDDVYLESHELPETEKQYGVVKWSIDDLLEKRPWLTEKQAHEVMAHIHKNLRKRQIEYG